jgi:2-polyprenyl-3-methyl-5-hydroxy-6-metoxy-1,4-benzoquinol methylase
MTSIHESELHRKEADYHDEWALTTPLDRILVRECFESPAAVENRFIIRQMGSLKGKKVLDIGAGLGESSVYFALQGALVTAVDVSPRMVETVMKLGQHHGVEINGMVSTGEHMSLPPDEFDLVYIANTIHHIQDRSSLIGQIYRTLKPGGRFFSIDPIAYNPVINVYRRMATETRTEDESPLGLKDLRETARYFTDLRHREFWIASLLLFVKYYLVDRVHPNEDRYWKRILKESWGTLWWWAPLRALDLVITRLPLIRYLSWNTVMWGTKTIP